MRHRIFEPFFSTKDATGLGLGLWVSEGILRKHNAHIAIRSRTDSFHGTVISMFFPGTQPTR
jgi:signal transduction histidine kinase